MQTLAFVNEIVGRASVVRGDGAVEPLREGDSLREGDFLLAADGRVRIMFADGSNLAIVDGGQLLLKQMVYDAVSNTGAITVAAAGGNFQFVPGALGDQPIAAILVETPAAIIHPGRSAFAFRHTSADGLGLSLIDASPSDSRPLVVDNDVGSLTITDEGQGISVSGASSAPVLVAELARAEPDSVAAEVSAGGDEGAFPGDPIVVTGAPELFDLAPEAAPLPGPYSGTWLPVSSPFVAPEHDDLFIGAQAAWLSADEASSGSGSGSGSSSGGSKYRTLTGWEPLNLVWELDGSGQVTGEAPTFPYGRNSLQIQPTEKNSMAGLALVSEQIPVVVLEEFFGLGGGSLARLSNGAVEGSAIRAPLALSAGAELSFDFFFDAGDTLPRNDFALAMVGGDTYKLSDIAGIADNDSTRNIDASGWRTVVYNVAATGTYTIGFASVDERTAADPSALYIDNVRVNRQFGADWVVVGGSEDGRWRTLVQGAVARDDDQQEFLTVGEDEVLLIPEARLLANDIDPDPFDPMRITGIDRTGTAGRATLGSGGIVTYRTAGEFNHLAEGQRATDSFRYLVDPGNGVESTATVRVTIIGANDAPVARRIQSRSRRTALGIRSPTISMCSQTTMTSIPTTITPVCALLGRKPRPALR